MGATNFLSHVRELYAHMEWADRAVWAALAFSPEATGDAAIRDLLFHSHFTQHAFLQFWLGESVDRPDPDRFTSINDLRTWAADNHTAIRDFVASVDETSLCQIAIVPWSRMFSRELGREAAPTTLMDTLVQVPAHSLYHRGQVNRRLREIGGEPPLVDFIVWKWLGEPALSR